MSMIDMERAGFMPIMDIQQAVIRREMIVDATQKLMKQGVDYGGIPGTERDVLLQPGADKLCNLFGLVVEYETDESIEDWRGAEHGGEPFFYYKIRGRAYRGDFLMGEGVGATPGSRNTAGATRSGSARRAASPISARAGRAAGSRSEE